MASVRRRVFFFGRVQGVGFRYTANTLAKSFAVTGWVRNLADGRVELLAEGEADEISRFLAAIAKSMGVNIQSTEVFEETPTGEFGDFRVIS